jgi:DUF1680 family protein
MELWRMTRDPAYLETAQHIRYNAFVHGQRPNGGFGCNTCAGAGDAFVTPVEALYEAWWCCTMRGAEGLARAIQYAWFQEDGRVCQLYGGESVLRADAGGGEAVLAQRSAWPYGEGLATDVASAAGGGDVELGWFIPSWVDQGQAAVAVDGQNLPLELDRGFARVALPLARGSRAEVRAPAALRASGPVSRHSIEDHQSLRRGPLVLTGGAEAPESVAAAEEGEKLRPLGGLYRMTEAEARRDRRRVLFTR